MKTNIGGWFPTIQSEAADLYQTMTGIAVVLVIAALTVKTYRACQGDLAEIWQALVSTVIIGILISLLPTMFNELQSAFHELAKDKDAYPSEVFSKLQRIIASSSSKESDDMGITDVLKSPVEALANAVLYGAVYLISKLAFGLQWMVFMFQQFLMLYGIAMAPLFLAFTMLKSLQPIAVKYFMGLVSVSIWPLGFLITSGISNQLLQAAASDGIYRQLPNGQILAGASALFFIIVLIIWTFVGTWGTPRLVTKLFTEGANAGAQVLSSFGMTFGQSATQGVGAGFTAALSGASPVGVGAAAIAGAGTGAFSGAVERGGLIAPTVIGLAASSVSGGKKFEDYQNQAQEVERKLRS